MSTRATLQVAAARPIEWHGPVLVWGEDFMTIVLLSFPDNRQVVQETPMSNIFQAVYRMPSIALPTVASIHYFTGMHAAGV